VWVVVESIVRRPFRLVLAPLVDALPRCGSLPPPRWPYKIWEMGIAGALSGAAGYLFLVISSALPEAF